MQFSLLHSNIGCWKAYLHPLGIYDSSRIHIIGTKDNHNMMHFNFKYEKKDLIYSK